LTWPPDRATFVGPKRRGVEQSGSSSGS
jgi:hypothetical protein